MQDMDDKFQEFCGNINTEIGSLKEDIKELKKQPETVRVNELLLKMKLTN